MRIALPVLLLLCSRVHAQDALPIEKVVALKKAAVFVKVEVDGRTGSGSGFVVHRDGRSAIVVTNLHVVEPKIFDQVRDGVPRNDLLQLGGKRPPRGPIGPIRPHDGIPRPSARTGPPPLRSIVALVKNAKVTLVFDSGARTERSAKGEVVAFDSENDLAALRVVDVENVPEPIDVAKIPELVETMAIYSFGFPFGKALAKGDKNPAMTVGKASVSGLREDDAGELHTVQVDGGSLNPGNSGGMVVDAQGRLVGVVVAGIQSSGIAFAIPGHRVASMFAGRLGAAEAVRAGDNRIDVDVNLVDPLGKVKAATLYYLAGPKDKFDLKKTKSLADVPGVKKLELKLDKQLASVRLPDVTNDREFYFQIKFTNATAIDTESRLAWASLRGATPVAGGPVAGPNAGGNDPLAIRLSPTKGGAGRETRIVAGAFDARFRDDAPAAGLLIGFEVGVSRTQVVNALRPLYRAGDDELFGKQYGSAPKAPIVVRARPGYAVAGVHVKSALTLEGLTVKFAKVVDGKLDLSETYLSDPLGNQTAAIDSTLGDDGSTIIGIVGSAIGDDVTGLGLVLRAR